MLLGAMLFVPLYLQASAWHAGFSQLGWFTIATDTVTSPMSMVMETVRPATACRELSAAETPENPKYG